MLARLQQVLTLGALLSANALRTNRLRPPQSSQRTQRQVLLRQGVASCSSMASSAIAACGTAGCNACIQHPHSMSARRLDSTAAKPRSARKMMRCDVIPITWPVRPRRAPCASSHPPEMRFQGAFSCHGLHRLMHDGSLTSCCAAAHGPPGWLQRPCCSAAAAARHTRLHRVS